MPFKTPGDKATISQHTTSAISRKTFRAASLYLSNAVAHRSRMERRLMRADAAISLFITIFVVVAIGCNRETGQTRQQTKDDTGLLLDDVQQLNGDGTVQGRQRESSYEAGLNKVVLKEALDDDGNDSANKLQNGDIGDKLKILTQRKVNEIEKPTLRLERSHTIQHQADSHWLSEELTHYEICLPILVDHRGDFLSYDITHNPDQFDDVTHRPNQDDDVVHRQDQYTVVSEMPYHDNNDVTKYHDVSNQRLSRAKRSLRTNERHSVDISENFNTTSTAKQYAGLVVEYWNSSGLSRRFQYKGEGRTNGCYYVGHVINEETTSRVALSTCHGLFGVFATNDEEFIIEPAVNSSTNNNNNNNINNTSNVAEADENNGLYHVIYRRTAVKRLHGPGKKDAEAPCGLTDVLHGGSFTSPQLHNGADKSAASGRPGIKTDQLQHHRYNASSSARRNLSRWDERKIHNGGEEDKNVVQRRRKKRRSRRVIRSVSRDSFVETLVVADTRMVAYHGRANLETYLLTIMNIVAKLFQDASLGNSVNIIVTRIIILTEEQPNLEINHNADKSLESFCKWQQRLTGYSSRLSNSLEERDVREHDNAVLLTRYDICTYRNQPCGTLGLAPVAGMCEADRSCSINEDIGLASAFTIAHEIGHNFGMQHDGAGNRCGTPGHETAKIMASQLAKNREPFSWSSCSKDYITAYLDSGRGDCLSNPPASGDNFVYPDELPGQIHDAATQCRYQFGPLSVQCKTYEEVCRELWCTNLTGQCVTNNIPAAEGTLCSTHGVYRGWCYHGACVKDDWHPTSIDGRWGPWSVWGRCSRSCGGGVESSQRFCNNPKPAHGGRICTGERQRYRSCNIKDCPVNSTDFREIQCAKFNSEPFRNKYYKWKPFTGAGQVRPCALNCLAVGHNFYTERAPKVIDGTPCHADSFDICINGECRSVGCDKILGSAAVEDKCRVCGGDGSTCDTYKHIVDQLLEQSGDSYVEVVRIPQGAVHIRVSETRFSKNYLALKSHDEYYYINGAWTIDWPRQFDIANTVFHYERPKDRPEILSALGPISEDLAVMVLLQEKSLGIEFEYNIKATDEAQLPVQYAWVYLPWTDCTVSCGKGVSRSVGACVRRDDTSVLVKAAFCEPSQALRERIKYCNEEHCPAEWSIGEWSTCSRTCGSGYKTRLVQCSRRISSTESETLDQAQCIIGGTGVEQQKKPKNRFKCTLDKCPPDWITDAWTECRPSCGPGLSTRNVYCSEATGVYVSHEACSAITKPPTSKNCEVRPCESRILSSIPASTASTWNTIQPTLHSAVKSCSSGKCDSRIQPSTVTARVIPTDCKDLNKVAYCPLVLKFKFCSRAYFRQMCCRTCVEAGL